MTGDCLISVAMSSACGSSALSVRSDASAASLRRSSSCARRLALRGIHPHVERPGLVAEATRGVVDLHRRHAEVREDHVRRRHSLCGEQLRQAREVAVSGDEDVAAEARGPQACFGARQFERIGVESDQASAGLQTLEDRLRVPAAAERAVNRDVAGHWPKTTQHFLQHDRPMRTGGAFGARLHLASNHNERWPDDDRATDQPGVMQATVGSSSARRSERGSRVQAV